MNSPDSQGPNPLARLSTGAAIALGAALVAVSGRIGFELPGTEVPQTAQTLAVLLVGGMAGPRAGAAALLLYLLAGAAGLPVFAGGSAGVAVLLGPTGGFIIGFVPGAALAGSGARYLARSSGNGWLHDLLILAGIMLTAHAVILLCGWARLAMSTGPGTALTAGVTPFLVGALVKSLLAAVIIGATAALLKTRTP